MLATSAIFLKKHLFVFYSIKPCLCKLLDNLKHSWPFQVIYCVFLDLNWPYIYIYIRNIVPGGNPAARFMLSFHVYAELEACRPLFGKIISIATR